MTICLLIPLLTGVICAFLGYFLGKSALKDSNATILDLNEELENCMLRQSQMKSDLETLRNDNRAIRAKKNLLYEQVENSGGIEQNYSNVDFNAILAKSVFGKTIKENDLKIIEGIGPKIEELFKTSGILTWRALSECTIDRLKSVLSKAGERYLVHDPSTWAKQAELAYLGEWEELKNWQSTLKGGKER